MAIDAIDDVYIADTGNHRIRRVNAATGVIDTIAGTGIQGYAGDGGPAISAWLQAPKQLFLDCNLEFGYGSVFAASQTGDHQRQFATRVTMPADGAVTSIAAYVSGDTESPYRYAIYSDEAGEPDTLISETTAANPPPGPIWFTIKIPATPLTAGTYWLALSADASDHTYQYDTARGRTRIMANPAAVSGFTATWGHSDDGNSRRISVYATHVQGANEVYVVDTDNDCVRRFIEGGEISTVAGTGTAGFSGDGGRATAAQVDGPMGVTVGVAGHFCISDTSNHRIRAVEPRSGVRLVRWQEVEP